MEIILASKSPRRQELLGRIVKDFTIINSNFDEDSVLYSGDPGKYVMELAKGKGEAVANNVSKPSVVIALDTIVVIDNEVLGKPKSKEDAKCMLKRLSGNNHKVYTGIYIYNNQTKKFDMDFAETTVKFSELTDLEIENYIDSNEPMDKAGAYGIQGLGGLFIESINGCYYNVMGLPLNVVYKKLNLLI
ncbi:MAG: Maf-like protein [Sarcina sp.]